MVVDPIPDGIRRLYSKDAQRGFQEDIGNEWHNLIIMYNILVSSYDCKERDLCE
jgi:hypothetical protein